MQKTLLFAALGLLLIFAGAAAAQAPGTPGLGDSLYPTFGNGGYDVEHYTLDMRVDPDAGSLSATLTLEATATVALSAFNLDFIGFELIAAQVNGQDAAYTRSGQELTLTPAVALREGEPFTATIAYQGTPTELTSVALPVLTGWVAYDGGSFVLSEPDGAANFYPVNDHPLDKATYTLRVTVPPPYQPAMNGVVTGVIENADGSTTTVSEVRQPMASYLTTINIAEFDLVQTPGANGVPLRDYFEQSLPVAYRAIFARQDEMMGYFQDVFGPYPFDTYGAVVVNTDTGSALESQTLSIFGVDSLDPDDIAGSELTVAHELAHQWLGNSVSVADWRDIWLNEGWATYSEGLWLEHTEGPDALTAWADDLYAYAADEALGAPAEPTGDNLFDDAVYVRGGLALHALRRTVGDAAFFEIAQAWASRYRDGNASTDDFVALVREIGGEDAGDALRPWLYAAVMPALP